MMRTPLLADTLSDATGLKPAPILSDACTLRRSEALLTFARVGQQYSFPSRAAEDFQALIGAVGPRYRQAARIPRRLRRLSGRPFRDANRISRTVFGVDPSFPAVLDGARLQIGFAIPVCEFGGVERVAHNLGRESRKVGWDPHLFVIGSPQARLLREFQDTFATVTVVPEDHACRAGQLLGLLGTMDIVVNEHCARLNGILGDLRCTGIHTFAHLHVVDLAEDGLPFGHPFLALDHEHVLDGVLVISEAMQRWCSARGFPKAKLIPVPNGPSFEISEAQAFTAIRQRSRRAPPDPLRVLYIGRFDRQKSVDRLIALVTESKRRALPFAWRVVGEAVMRDVDSGGWDISVLQDCLHPVAMTNPAIARHYAWADVVVLVSRYEGVPLTILEAQRFGCVVLSTNVGAISESIEDGKTGFLFSNKLDTPNLVGRMLSRLIALHEDRSLLMAVGERAAEIRRTMSWSRAFARFARFVELLHQCRGVR